MRKISKLPDLFDYALIKFVFSSVSMQIVVVFLSAEPNKRRHMLHCLLAKYFKSLLQKLIINAIK